MDEQPIQPTVFQPDQSEPVVNQPQPQLESPHAKHAHRFIFGYLLIILLVVAVGATYAWQNNKVKNLNGVSAQLATANSKIASLNKTIAAQNQPYLYLSSYGLKIPLSKGIEDLYYVDIRQASGDELTFSTQSLANLNPSCVATAYGSSYTASGLGLNATSQTAGPSPFGIITVTPKPLPSSLIGKADSQIGTFVVSSNGYYFYYKQNQGPGGCILTGANATLQSQQSQLLMTALKNIQPINKY